MKKATIIVRVLMGLVFSAAALAALLMPNPPPPENMKPFIDGILSTKYFFPLLKGTELVCGLMLVAGVFVPLALVVLAPVILNIFLVHAFMAPEGLPLAIFLGGCEVYLAFFAEPYAPIVKQLFRCPKREAMLAKKG